MLRGYYTSVNGILNEERILNVITNNLSNTNTAGYKSDAAIPTTFHDNLFVLGKGHGYAVSLAVKNEAALAVAELPGAVSVNISDVESAVLGVCSVARGGLNSEKSLVKSGKVKVTLGMAES